MPHSKSALVCPVPFRWRQTSRYATLSLQNTGIPLTIRRRLILIGLLLVTLPTILATILIGHLALHSGQQALETRAHAQLVAIRDVKKAQIENYFRTIANQTLSMAQSITVLQALREFQQALPKVTNEFNTQNAHLLDKYYLEEFATQYAKLNLGDRYSDNNSLIPQDQITRQLQTAYIATNIYPIGHKDKLIQLDNKSQYNEVHARYHSQFRDFIQRFNFYDAFLVDAQTGRVLYTVFKETDFANFLTHGILSTTNIAKVFQQALQYTDPDEVALSDFSPYLPSYQRQAAFVAAPIRDNNKTLGVLIFQLSPDRINSVMSYDRQWETSGLGRTGETYLIGKDKKLRSATRSFLEDPDKYYKELRQQYQVNESIIQKIKASNSLIGLVKYGFDSANLATQGKTGFIRYTAPNGHAIFSAYAPLAIRGLNWAILSEIHTDEALADAYQMEQRIAQLSVVILIFLLLMCGYLAWHMARRMVKPVYALVKDIQQFRENPAFNAANPDLIKRDDEIGTVSKAIYHLIRTVQEREQISLQAQEHIQRIIDTTLDAIININGQGIVTLWSKPAEAIFGYSASEAVGKPVHELIIPPALRQAHIEGMARFNATGQGKVLNQRLELPAMRKNGEIFPAELSICAIEYGNEKGFSAFLRDITARKNTENELLKAKESAEMANRTKSDFLANMSHEIRTPMNGVIGMTDLLLNTPLNQEQREYANIVRTSGEALLELINDILDFSKVEAGKLSLEKISFNLYGLVEDIIDLFGFKAHENKIELVMNIAPDVPQYIIADPGRLRQILTNLVSNAIKFTTQGSVQLDVSLSHTEGDHSVLQFDIQDTGIGISKENLAALFNPFTQVDASTTRKYGGTGLGLSICRRLVELMGGKIGVNSEENKGSHFWFSIDYEITTIPAEARPPQRIPLQNKKILVVDDHPTNRRWLEAFLKQWGAQVVSCTQAHQTLQTLDQAFANKVPFDLALLDMQMPDMDGEALGKIIKAHPNHAHIPLVMLSSIGQRGDSERLRALQFAAYVTKPIKQSQLHDILCLVLGRQQETESPVLDTLVTRHTLEELRRQRAHILVVDDNPVNLKVVTSMLERMGYTTQTALNGKLAFECLTHTSFDLVLMDCQMPEMDGFTATRAIRQGNVLNPHIPIIALTANALVGDREKCLEAGMNDYLAKPVIREQLTKLLDQWLVSIPLNTSTLTGDYSMNDSTKSSSSIPQPLFDINAMLRVVDDDHELLQITALAIADNISERLEALQQAFQAKDTETITREIHTLKSHAATAGAQELRTLMQDLEKRSREQQSIETSAGEIRVRYLALQSALRAHFNQPPVATSNLA